MTTATKTEYHIIYDDGTVIAKFTATKIPDVWKKYNKRCRELLRDPKDIACHESFGAMAWEGRLKRDYRPVTLRLAKVTSEGYVFENKEFVTEG